MYTFKEIHIIINNCSNIKDLDRVLNLLLLVQPITMFCFVDRLIKNRIFNLLN